MKICFLADASSIHTRKWIKYFSLHRHSVSLISLEPLEERKGMEDIDFFLFKNLPFQKRPFSTIPNVLHKSLQTRLLLKRIQPDIIHAHSFVHYGWLNFLSGFHPQVITAWGSDTLIFPRQSRIFRAQVTLSLKTADLVTCDAEHIQQPLIDLGAGPEKIQVINFGIDTQRFHPGARNERIREKLGISNHPTVISLRSLRPIYDIESLIRAVPRVTNRNPDVKFIIAGDGPEKSQLQSLAGSLGVSESIRFIGNIPNDELPQYLAASDIYVSTSLSDAGLSASTAEAMSCGLPVVITDFGDNRKWVAEGVNGHLIPLRNPEVLASRINQLVQNREQREAFGKANRKVIMEKNDYNKEMSKMESLYQKLIDRRN